MTNSSNLGEEWIESHSRLLHSLAGALLRDPAHADDAVQDAWVAALARPPHHRLAAWLQTVVRRRIARFTRDAVRRERRERGAARPEALDSTLSLVERAEMVRLIGEVVANLRPPYREILLLRFYEGLAPRVIAEKLGIKVATVHARVRRALEIVRCELELRDNAASWRGTLAAVVGFDARMRHLPVPRTITGLGVLGMNMKLTGVAALAALILTLGYLVLKNSNADARPDAVAVRSEDAMLASPGRKPAAPPAALGGLATSSGERVVVSTLDDSSAADATTSIRVVDGDGLPVAGAELRSGPEASRLQRVGETDAQGRFELSSARNARVVVARSPGWAPSAACEVPASGTTRELVLHLTLRGCDLAVQVRDPRGAPLAGASVFAGRDEEITTRLADGTRARTLPGLVLTTDEAGLARFEGLAPGWLRIAVDHETHARQVKFATLRIGEPTQIDIQVEQGFFVEGVVSDENGTVISDAVVARNGNAGKSVRSDANGTYRLGPLARGKVIATDPSGRRAETRLRGDSGATVRWDPVLECGPRVRGRAFDSAGAALAGLSVTAHHETWPGWTRGATTDDSGRFEICGCPPRRLRVELRTDSRDAFPIWLREDVAPGPDELAIEIVRATPGALRARVVRGDGGSPRELELRLQHVTTQQRQRLTAGPGISLELERETGEFSVTDIPPGRYRIVALGTTVGWTRLAEFELESGRELDLGTLEVEEPGSLRTRFLRPFDPHTTQARFLLERRTDFVTIESIVGEFPAELSLAPGRYTLQVEILPGPLTDHAFEIRSGQVTELEVDLRPVCLHRVRVRHASGREPVGTVTLRVDQVDVERTITTTPVSQIENGAWWTELELEPGRFTFRAETAGGSEVTETLNLYTSSPGNEIVLVLED